MTIAADLRHAVRVLARKPGLTLVVVLTVALGVGATSAIFSLVHAVVLRQLPFERPDRLVWIWHVWTGGDTGVFAVPDYGLYRSGNESMADIAAFRGWGANLSGEGLPERLSGIRVSENFFETLGVQALVGRRFTEAEIGGRSAPVVMITFGLWQRRFGGEASIVGRTLVVNAEPYTVVGVLPSDFVFPITDAEVAIPLALERDPTRNQPGFNSLRLIGRLKDGVAAAQAKGDLDRITARLRELYPRENAGKFGVRLVPVMDQIVGPYRRTLWLLFAAVTAVLVMASVNLANLLLTHAASRQREFAVRAAIGAGTRALVQQSLVEATVLALAGGAAGIAVARLALAQLVTIVPADIPRLTDASIDRSVLVFALVVSIATGLLFGLAPALHVARQHPRDGLGGMGRGVTGARTRRTRGRLLAFETGCALTLLVCAALFIESFVRLQAVTLGFDPAHVLTARVSLPQARYRSPEAIGRFHDAFADRVRAHAGVTAIAAVSVLPLGGGRSTADFTIEGRPAPRPDQRPQSHFRMIGAEYFRAMKIPIEAGRSFDEHDRGDSPLVAIVNHTLAERFWPHDSPIGSRLLLDAGDDHTRKLLIVGVAGDIRHTALDAAPENDIYVPIHQMPPVDVGAVTNSMYWVIRTSSLDERPTTNDALPLTTTLQTELRGIDADIPVSNVRSLEQVLGRALAPKRFLVLLLSAFAMTALGLAALGIYGVTNQMALQRNRELGIRVALGAQRRDIVRLVTIDGLGPVMRGIALGIGGSYVAGQLARGLLYDVSTVDPVRVMLVAVCLGVLSLLAAVVPANRAARTDPRVTLTAE